jgi:hypothetical protein
MEYPNIWSEMLEVGANPSQDLVFEISKIIQNFFNK